MAKKTKEIKATDRESLKEELEKKEEQKEELEKKEEQKEEQPAEKNEKWYGVSVTLTPVQHKQLEILAQLAHNKTPEEYTKSVLLQHIADRLYLVQR